MQTAAMSNATFQNLPPPSPGFIEQDTWEASVCGRIYKHLLSQPLGVEISVEGKNTCTTVFRVAKECFVIHTLNFGHGVGSREVRLRPCAEQWQVERFPCWRLAIESIQPVVIALLPMPLSRLAEAHGLEDADQVFDIETIVKSRGIQSAIDLVVARGQTERLIRSMYERKLTLLGFNIINEVGHLRLMSTRQDADLEQAGKLLAGKTNSLMPGAA